MRLAAAATAVGVSATSSGRVRVSGNSTPRAAPINTTHTMTAAGIAARPIIAAVSTTDETVR
jgi:hypothetical protein